MSVPSSSTPHLRRFHQARWDEPIIFELSQPGQRGLLVPPPEPEMRAQVGDPLDTIPPALHRRRPPALPELAQPQVLRHYLRLSQETLGADLIVDAGQGTCTMKYSPKVHERLARLPQMAELHPLQDEATVQGILEIMYRFEQILKAISGMDRFSLQPQAGSAAIYANASMVRAYHAARGEAEQRDEIITTLFSHPSDAAAAAAAGFKVVILYPEGEQGYPSVEALKAAVSERTAGLFITNPEDTGIFNPHIADFTRIVHEAGGLCVYDQANANGILGITRAREAGFDLCHFNLHKTFSSPHGSGGPGAGAVGVTAELEPFLPVPVVEYDGERYYLDYDRLQSIGKVAMFYGNVPVVLRSYAWVMSLGAEGLREVAEVAVLNNNYLLEKIRAIRGADAPFAPGRRRIEQVRYSWQALAEETGVHTEDLGRRAADFGVQYWLSHHPWYVPEPVTLEPTESYTRAELDEYAAILAQAATEAYEDPEFVRNAPHRSTIHRLDPAPLDDPELWAM
ncbi:MAG: glycine dehydrogenase subunit 2, partial [Caldilineae bacterium]